MADKNFESAIEKIQGENEANLRTAEKWAVQFLLKPDASDSESESVADDDEAKSDSSVGYADSAIRAIENAKRNRIPSYEHHLCMWAPLQPNKNRYAPA